MMLSSRLEPGRVPLGIGATRRPGRVVTICTAKRRMLNTGETHADE
jgi:hypothetical protein